MTHTDLQTKLNALVEGLLFLSESDYPFHIQIIEKISDLDLSKAKEISITNFLQNAATHKEWHDKDEKATVIRYQKLLNFINESCHVVAVYKTPTPLATIYAVLQVEDNPFVVLSTQVVET
jgi:hypothetical protein